MSFLIFNFSFICSKLFFVKLIKLFIFDSYEIKSKNSHSFCFNISKLISIFSILITVGIEKFCFHGIFIINFEIFPNFIFKGNLRSLTELFFIKISNNVKFPDHSYKIN